MPHLSGEGVRAGAGAGGAAASVREGAFVRRRAQRVCELAAAAGAAVEEAGGFGEAVAARRRLHDLGVTRALLEGIGEMLGAGAGDAVLDAGCGEGFYLGELARAGGFEGHGVDISVAAVELAAKRYPGCEWIVGNADRGVPYSDGSFSRVMSITGRMNAAEFRRVLREDGRLVVAVASPEDLIELRGWGRIAWRGRWRLSLRGFGWGGGGGWKRGLS